MSLLCVLRSIVTSFLNEIDFLLDSSPFAVLLALVIVETARRARLAGFTRLVPLSFFADRFAPVSIDTARRFLLPGGFDVLSVGRGRRTLPDIVETKRKIR